MTASLDNFFSKQLSYKVCVPVYDYKKTEDIVLQMINDADECYNTVTNDDLHDSVKLYMIEEHFDTFYTQIRKIVYVDKWISRELVTQQEILSEEVQKFDASLGEGVSLEGAKLEWRCYLWTKSTTPLVDPEQIEMQKAMETSLIGLRNTVRKVEDLFAEQNTPVNMLDQLEDCSTNMLYFLNLFEQYHCKKIQRIVKQETLIRDLQIANTEKCLI